ncbi:MAG: hypothetical protein HQK52_23770 [Oligoflexia bacterium]|nr:hypothetical protein [Oligoflexia bacterium]
MYKSSLNASAKFFSEQKIEDESIYFMVEVTASMPMEKIKKVKIDEDYEQLLLEQYGAEEFRQRCGDEFVDAVQRGGKLFGLVQIKTHSQEERKKIEIAINGNVGKTFTAAMSLKQAVQEIVKSYRYDMFFFQVGGIVKKIPLSTEGFDELFEQAQDFAKDLVNNNAGALILASTAPYTQAINYPRTAPPMRVDNKATVVDSLGALRFSILKTLRYLDDVIANPQNHEKYDSNMSIKLGEARDRFLKNMNVLMSFADDCFYDINKCREPAKTDGFDMTAAPQIERLDGVVDPGTAKTKITEKYCRKYQCKEGTGSVCGIIGFISKRDPVCGVELYKEGKDEKACGAEEIEGLNLPDNGTMRFSCHTSKDMPNPTLGPRGFCPRLGFEKGYWKYINDSAHTPNGGSCPRGNRSVFALVCTKTKTCRHEAFGVESYKECEHPTFGSRYGTCRHESFGNTGECLEWGEREVAK